MDKIAIPKLKVVVCGMEHAGTTLLAQLLRQHPHLETGYEVGALMHPNLSAFWNDKGTWKQYRDPTNRYGLKQGWQLDDLGYEALQLSGTWAEFYERLAIHSPLVRDETAFLIDKTPPYQAVIDTIALRFDVPIVIIIKDPVLLYDSWSQRRATSIQQFGRYYAGRAAATKRAVSLFPSQVLIIAYEALIRNTGLMMEEVFEHIGIEPMLIPDVLDVDFPEKVPNQIIDDIHLRLMRVGATRADQLRRVVPQYQYLDGDGSLMHNDIWWK